MNKNFFLDLTEWSAWDECSVTCGGSEISRTRSCKNGVQGDIGCIGDLKETDSCNTQDCPCEYHAYFIWNKIIFKDLTEWSSWSQCSVTCAGGTQTRNRLCENGSFGEIGCEGPNDMSQPCNTQACPPCEVSHLFYLSRRKPLLSLK